MADLTDFNLYKIVDARGDTRHVVASSESIAVDRWKDVIQGGERPITVELIDGYVILPIGFDNA